MTRSIKIIICYHRDLLKTVRDLKDKMKSSGVRAVLIDESEKNTPGVLKKIKAADAFVVVLDKNLNNSDGVLFKIENAYKLKKSIFTFQYENTMPNDVLNYYVCNHQWIDFSPNRVDRSSIDLTSAMNIFNPEKDKIKKLKSSRKSKLSIIPIVFIIGLLAIFYFKYLDFQKMKKELKEDRPIARDEKKVFFLKESVVKKRKVEFSKKNIKEKVINRPVVQKNKIRVDTIKKKKIVLKKLERRSEVHYLEYLFSMSKGELDDLFYISKNYLLNKKIKVLNKPLVISSNKLSKGKLWEMILNNKFEMVADHKQYLGKTDEDFIVISGERNVSSYIREESNNEIRFIENEIFSKGAILSYLNDLDTINNTKRPFRTIVRLIKIVYFSGSRSVRPFIILDRMKFYKFDESNSLYLISGNKVAQIDTSKLEISASYKIGIKELSKIDRLINKYRKKLQ